MRTLHRPMFNMGGPIKEGVMHGIREPYAGGQLVRPGPGRPGYGGEDFWTRFLANYTPKAFSSPKKIISRLNPFKRLGGLKYVKPAVKTIKGSQPFKNMQGIFTRKTQTPGITGTTSGSAWAAGPAKYWAHMKKTVPAAKHLWNKHRYKTLIGAPIAAPYAIEMAKKIPFSKIGDLGKGYVEKWKDVLGIEGKEPDKITTAQLPPGGGETALGSGEATYTKPSPVDNLLAGAGNEEFALAQRNKRVKKYLDLMGYDRSKRTAIGDALIDASKIVSDRGSLDLKNITRELINPVIQATSKRLDKPEQIREAVGLMMTKAGLEKEMYDAKPGTILKNVQDMIKSGIPKDEAWAIATKGSKGVVSDLQAALATGKMSATDWPAFVRATGAEHGEEVSVVTKKQLKEKGMDEMTSEEVIASIGGGDGIFIIGDETIRIIGGKATQIK